eukprot:CAMPEP_0170729526 /NCGR_PEP_ID=MMETSP0437-20130122/59_1 /TAXON_ID=0 /ORGANISM="Sexangularia sp." /LENGTH=127 /DNA_ID=CAMNT_0011067689 /DNA_START=38 /DNA_END=421 /DNA_ORIENTATION=-
MRISMVSVLVDDFDEAIAWYGAIGFKVGEDKGSEDDKRGRFVRLDSPDATGPSLLLQKVPGGVRASRPDVLSSLVMGVLTVDDFAATYRAFVDAGVCFLEQPRHEAYGTVAIFEDLYGTRWDLIQVA